MIDEQYTQWSNDPVIRWMRWNETQYFVELESRFCFYPKPLTTMCMTFLETKKTVTTRNFFCLFWNYFHFGHFFYILYLLWLIKFSRNNATSCCQTKFIPWVYPPLQSFTTVRWTDWCSEFNSNVLFISTLHFYFLFLFHYCFLFVCLF